MIFKKATIRAVKVIILGLVVLLCYSDRAIAAVLRMIYIEAGEGNSSGGHFAVQLGDSAYHYQDDNGLIRLFKSDAEVFQADYRYRQNRSLNVADIGISDETFEILQSYFKEHYFLQKQQLNEIRTARNDSALLQALLNAKLGRSNEAIPQDSSVPLIGAGLFFEAGKPPQDNTRKCNTSVASTKILSEIEQLTAERLGKTFLFQKIANLQNQIRQLSPIAKHPAMSSSGRYAFSEQYSDLLTGFLALTALINHQPLTGNACFNVDGLDMTLPDSGLLKARSLLQQLKQSALSLLTSGRPDWGYALMVTLARAVVLEHSLQTGRWIFLTDEDSSDDNGVISSEQLNLYADTVKMRRSLNRERLDDNFTRFLNSTGATEQYYTNLEQAANRYRQWSESERSGILHTGNQYSLPRLSAPAVAYLMTDLTPNQITKAIQQVRVTERRLIEKDKRRNTYNLITKNCVSALLELINNAVSNQSDQRLGGTFDPKSNFIPFQAFAAVKNTYRVTETRRLPSYREDQLTRFYAKENSGLVFLRESNVFSSSVYRLNPDDAWFIFFTDDAVVSRPLFGAVNFLISTSQTLYGMTQWPFDGGANLRTGLRGLLASLPELAFFNIRKGSYPYLMLAN